MDRQSRGPHWLRAEIRHSPCFRDGCMVCRASDSPGTALVPPEWLHGCAGRETMEWMTWSARARQGKGQMVFRAGQRARGRDTQYQLIRFRPGEALQYS